MLKEVHLLFDEFDNTVAPKIFERTRRTNVTCNGEEITISDETNVQYGKKWQEFISNRDNKQNLWCI